MSNCNNTDQYYLIGYPAKHSLSPRIHTQFAKQYNQTMHYGVIETAPPEDLVTTLEKLRRNSSVKGLSITTPFKEKLFHYCDYLEQSAQETKAVSNVIINPARAFIGVNLDGAGLVRDIYHNLKINLQQKSILILGAGGAAKGILPQILKANPQQVVIANRTVSKASQLANSLNNHVIKITGCGLHAISGNFDMVINATSASIGNNTLPLSPHHFKQHGFGYDLMYKDNGTVFTQWCRRHNIAATDGKGMLIEISKIIFYRWRSIKVDSMICKDI